MVGNTRLVMGWVGSRECLWGCGESVVWPDDNSAQEGVKIGQRDKCAPAKPWAQAAIMVYGTHGVTLASILKVKLKNFASQTGSNFEFRGQALQAITNH